MRVSDPSLASVRIISIDATGKLDIVLAIEFSLFETIDLREAEVTSGASLGKVSDMTLLEAGGKAELRFS